MQKYDRSTSERAKKKRTIKLNSTIYEKKNIGKNKLERQRETRQRNRGVCEFIDYVGRTTLDSDQNRSFFVNVAKLKCHYDISFAGNGKAKNGNVLLCLVSHAA